MAFTVTYTRNVVKNDFQTNTFTGGNQLRPEVLDLGNGGFAAAYSNAGGIVRIDFYGSGFNSLGPATNPATSMAAFTGQPSLAELADGKILMAWSDNSSGGVKGRLFTSNGGALGTQLSLAGNSTIDPEIAALKDGGFAVTGTDAGNITAYLFPAQGGVSLIPVNTVATTGTQKGSSVATLLDGGFVVTYTDTNPADDVIRGAIYNANGSVRKTDFVIDAIGANTNSSVAGLPDGNWAVVYTDTGWGGGEGSTSGITLKIFGPTGNAVSGFVHVNQPTGLRSESDPDVTVLANGFLVVTWTSPFLSNLDIYARVFDQSGNPIQINGSTNAFPLAATGLDETFAAVSGIAGGTFTASWQDETTDLSFGQIRSEIDEITRTVISDGAPDAIVGDQLGDFVDGGGGADQIFGGGGKDVLEGGPGFDKIYGGPDNDQLFAMTFANFSGDNPGGSLNGDAGDDYLYGSSGIDHIFGGSGNDHLVGVAGADDMHGGTGIDVYDVDNTGDVVDEAGGDGIDSVLSSISFSLSDTVHVKGEVEHLFLSGSASINGTGNGLANIVNGNAGANRLDGAGGADMMRGHAGSDTYVVDNPLDVVDESIAGSTGTDLVRSSIGFNLGDTAHARGAIENLSLTGSAAINATGNGFANVLTGNAAANVLDGRGGADTMRGLAGSDTYVVDNIEDVADESAIGDPGIDLVRSSVSFSLADAVHVKGAVENLTLTGAGAMNGTGNALANVIIGSSAANILAGNLGNDFLTGGGGNDTFLFDTKPKKKINVDHITDLTHRSDVVELDHNIFKKLHLGKLKHDAFYKSTDARHAHDSDDRIIYNETTGKLYYDKDGDGGHHAKLFAVLDDSPDHVGARDFLIIA